MQRMSTLVLLLFVALAGAQTMRISLLLIASSLDLVRSDGCNCYGAPGEWIPYAEPLAGTGEEGYLCTQLACCTGHFGSASDGLCCEGNIMNECCRPKCSGANETGTGAGAHGRCPAHVAARGGVWTEPNTHDRVAGCPCTAYNGQPSGDGRDSGGCCLGSHDNWCSENYESGFVCENNACGNDDCCVPQLSAAGYFIILLFLGTIVSIICCVVACIVKACNRPPQTFSSGGGVPQQPAVPGVQPGIQMTAMPGIPAATVGAAIVPQNNSVVVTCPPGLRPGDPMDVVGPNGQAFQVQVPAGVAEGGQFMAMVPTPQPIVATAVAMPQQGPPVAQAVVVGQAGVATGQEIHMPQQHRPGDHGISWGGF